MKYGEHFEEESVPEWNIHNLDYNALKNKIKTNTTKDQATIAIAIPGQQDVALQRFEDSFYNELTQQHDRVNLFVNNKAGEISRRLDYLSSLINRLILQTIEQEDAPTPKQRRRFAKFQRQVGDCGNDIKLLGRFINAQVTGFRKLLKKYKKWTGSLSLGSRFKENILNSPKSFTKRDLHPLQLQYRELQDTLKSASSRFESHHSYEQESCADPGQIRSHRRGESVRFSRSRSGSITAPPIITAAPVKYWNEYECGSEIGDSPEDDSYVIYIDPNQSDFSGLKTMFTAPVDKVRQWLRSRGSTQSGETQSLLGGGGGGSGDIQSPVDYFSTFRSTTSVTTDNEASEDEYASSDEFPAHYDSTFLAFPSIEDQKLANFRDKVMIRGMAFCFLVSFTLLVIAGILVGTGRNKQRLEVDAGAIVGCVVSLFASCMGLGTMFARQEAGWMYTICVWAAFLTVCILNAMLLVLIVGSNGL